MGSRPWGSRLSEPQGNPRRVETTHAYTLVPNPYHSGRARTSQVELVETAHAGALVDTAASGGYSTGEDSADRACSCSVLSWLSSTVELWQSRQRLRDPSADRACEVGLRSWAPKPARTHSVSAP